MNHKIGFVLIKLQPDISIREVKRQTFSRKTRLEGEFFLSSYVHLWCYSRILKNYGWNYV